MQVSLKRADVYARLALQAANEMTYVPSISLSIYSAALYAPLPTPSSPPVEDQVRLARQKLLEQHQDALDLLEACYAIRGHLAQANLTHGVSALLTHNARLSVEEARTRDFIRAIDDTIDCEQSADAALAKAQALRQSTGERLLRREGTVSVALITDADLAWLRKDLKRVSEQRAANNEALTKANVSFTITLSEATVNTLRRMDILPAAGGRPPSAGPITAPQN